MMLTIALNAQSKTASYKATNLTTVEDTVEFILNNTLLQGDNKVYQNVVLKQGTLTFNSITYLNNTLGAYNATVDVKLCRMEVKPVKGYEDMFDLLLHPVDKYTLYILNAKQYIRGELDTPIEMRVIMTPIQVLALKELWNTRLQLELLLADIE